MEENTTRRLAKGDTVWHVETRDHMGATATPVLYEYKVTAAGVHRLKVWTGASSMGYMRQVAEERFSLSKRAALMQAIREYRFMREEAVKQADRCNQGLHIVGDMLEVEALKREE
ncbi:MAG TPA: hypothetical protein VG476_12615 [Acidimicrobiales bacterium]|nr:hypothetical protein [Acidimicrobiales bacterium]